MYQWAATITQVRSKDLTSVLQLSALQHTTIAVLLNREACEKTNSKRMQTLTLLPTSVANNRHFLAIRNWLSSSTRAVTRVHGTVYGTSLLAGATNI